MSSVRFSKYLQMRVRNHASTGHVGLMKTDTANDLSLGWTDGATIARPANAYLDATTSVALKIAGVAGLTLTGAGLSIGSSPVEDVFGLQHTLAVQVFS